MEGDLMDEERDAPGFLGSSLPFPLTLPLSLELFRLNKRISNATPLPGCSAGLSLIPTYEGGSKPGFLCSGIF